MKTGSHKQPPDIEQRIAALVRTLRETENELQNLTGKQLDAVMDAAGKPFLLREAQEKLRRSEAMQRQAAETQSAILNALPAHIALLGPDGVIVAVNEAWSRFASANELPGPASGVGRNYLDVCEGAHGECAEEAMAAAAGIRMVLKHETNEFSLEYPCHSPNEKRWFRLMVTPLHDPPSAGVVVMHINVTERRLAEEALRDSENRLRTIVESEPECVKIVALDGELLDLNPAGLRMIEAESSVEVLGQPVLDLIHPDDRAAYSDQHRRASHGETTRLQFRLIGLKGTERWMESHSTPLRAADGNIISVLSITRDITERRRAEAERNQLFNLSLDLLCVAGFDGRLKQVNPAWTECLGWSAEELTSRPMLELILPEDHQATRRIREQIYRGEPIRGFENRYRCKDGDFRWLSWNVHPLPEARQVFAVARDVTEQKRSAIALAESQRRYRDLVETAHNVIWSIDREGRYTFVNRACGAVYGYQPTEMVGRHFSDFVPPEQFEKDSVIPGEMLEGRSEVLGFVSPIIRKDGGLAIMSSNARVTRGESGEVTGISGISQDITESLCAQEALRQKEERYRALFDRSLDAVYVHDLQGRFIDANPAALKLLGYQREEIQKLDFAAILADKEDISRAHELLQLHLDSDAPPGVQEFQLRRKSGARIWVELVSSLVYADDRAVAVQGIARDITERKLSEGQLRKLSQAVEQSPASTIITDTAGRIEYVNRKFTELTGYTQKEIEGRNVNILKGTEAPPKIYQELWQTIMSGGEWCGEFHNRKKNGEFFWERASIAPVHDAAGNITHFLAVKEDITDRKQAEASLRESEERFRQLADNINEAFWVLDPGRKQILYVSPAYERIWGRTCKSLYQSRSLWLDSIHPDDRGGPLEATTLQTVPEDAIEKVYRIVRPDGGVRWIRDRAFPVRDASGQVFRLVGTAEDITEQRADEVELARINRALQMLSACNEALIRASDEQELLDQICRITVEQGGYRMAWVGFALDDEARTIDPRAIAGEECGYFSEVKMSWSEQTATGRGPAGRTIREGRPSICADIERDPTLRNWRKAATRRGYRSVICLPLREGGNAFGVLGLYSAEVHRASDDELKLLQELADDLAFGIVNLRGELERRRMQDAVVKVAAGVSASTGTEFFEKLALNMTGALAAQAGFVARLLPGKNHTVSTVAAVIEGQVVDDFDFVVTGTPCESLVTSDEGIISRREQPGQFDEVPLLASLATQTFVGHRLNDSAGQLLGLLFVLFREPLQQFEFVSSTMQIFAARAASELERQRSDEQLREKAALLAVAHEAIYVTDLDDRIIYWNKGAEQTYGWTAAEAIQQKSADLFRFDEAKFGEARAGLLTSCEWRGELKARNKQNQELIVEVGWTLMHDSAGNPKSLLAINADITEKKKLEAQFLRAQRMESIGTLAGGIAHDLNNVLAPILISVQLLQDEIGSDDGRAMLNTMESCAQRGADLIKQVLTFARGIEGERIEVNVGHLLRDIRQIMRETFPKNIETSYRPTKDLWTLTGDPTQLHQVFMNLCVNARDAMPLGGQLAITTRNVILDEVYAEMNPEAKAGSYVLIAVEDSGSGIAPEVRDRIFEPFFTTKEVGNGTGLGLSTVLTIVRSHGGFINLDSELGRGTSFEIYLPAKVHSGGSGTVDPLASELPRGHGESILVVDDEENIRRVVKSTLERWGYRVILAIHGAEAVSLYAQYRHEIAVVVTDLTMPVMDGAATIMALKAMNPNVPIIASSGNSVGEGDTRLNDEGVRYFVSKPYTTEKLLRTIARVITETSRASD